MATARPHVAPGTLDGIARQLDSLRRGLDAATVVVLCTERGATFEVDAELPDVPIGEVVHTTVRVQT